MRFLFRFALVSGGLWLILSAGLLSLARESAPRQSYWLAYVRQTFGQINIYRSLPDGSGQVRILEDVSFLHRISFAPDGKSMVFDGELNEAPFHQVYRYTFADGSLEQITRDHVRAFAPAWSPDGEWIAYIGVDNLGNATPRNPNMPNTFIVNFAQVYLIRPDGTDAHPIAQTVNDGRVQWSSDGEWIAYVHFTDESGADIFITRPDGTDQRQLTTAQGDDLSPAWSPDGKRIAFISDRDTLSGNYILYVMNADGSNQQRLVSHFSFNGAPQWSPDGEWIAYVDNLSGVYEIYRIRPDGSDLQQITQFGYHGGQTWAPAWSPVVEEHWRGGYLMPLGAILLIIGLISRRGTHGTARIVVDAQPHPVLSAHRS